MGGDNMPVQMIGDILAAELSHMQPYIHFCSCQINGATLLQTRIDNEPDFKDFLKVGVEEEDFFLFFLFFYCFYTQQTVNNW